VAFTGGGTAGHVFPGLAVWRELESLAAESGTELDLVWLGSRKGMEKGILKGEGIPYRGFFSGKLRRYFSFQNFLDLFRLAAGFTGAFFYLLRKKPDILFSKGGFVSVPPVAAAGLLGIPVFVHESDADPGLATRIGSRFARRILVSYPETRDCFPPARRELVTVTGNPVREAVYRGNRQRGRELLGLDDATPLLLVLGGSQGALQVNLLVEALAPELVRHGRILHQMGSLTFKESSLPGYETRDFIRDELPDFMAAADLVLGRAGAATLWELAVLGKPMVLIPLGTGSSRGDQLRNARIFERRGAARVFQGEVNPGELGRTLTELLTSPELRKKMGETSASLAGDKPGRTIAGLIMDFLARGKEE